MRLDGIGAFVTFNVLRLAAARIPAAEPAESER